MSCEEIPKGVIPYVSSPDCNKHIEWLKNVFNAEEKELVRTEKKDKVMHCAMIINGGYLYLCDASIDSPMEENPSNAHDAEDGEPAAGFKLHVELEDPNVFWKKALANGATVADDLKTQYWGAEYGCLMDPFGFYWALMKGGECRKLGVITYLVTPDGESEKEIEWLKSAFGAEVKAKYMSKDNLVQHCSLEINGGVVYLGDQSNSPGLKCREKASKPRFIAHMNVPDTKTMWDGAQKNGGKTILELKVQFWGDLYGTVEDSLGFHWGIMEAKPQSSEQKNENHGVQPCIHSPDCTKHIEFVKNVFGGEVKEIYHDDSKKVMHCNMSVNGGSLLMRDRLPREGVPEIQNGEEPKGFLCNLNVADPDMVWKKAMANGATQVMELKQQFWGDYYGTFNDPFGYEWAIRKV